MVFVGEAVDHRHARVLGKALDDRLLERSDHHDVDHPRNHPRDILGFTLHVSTPNGYEVDAAAAGVKRRDCFKVFKDPLDACRNADVVTTDVWTSMGYEAESAERMKAFADWCVDR